jgi:hypothetical protein
MAAASAYPGDPEDSRIRRSDASKPRSVKMGKLRDQMAGDLKLRGLSKLTRETGDSKTEVLASRYPMPQA